jgi:hypothetical protein
MGWGARRLITALCTGALTLLPALALAGPLADALLRSDNFKVRLKAANELGKSPDPQALPALLRALEDQHPLVRAAAAGSLGRLKAYEALPGLCALRGDADAFVQQTAQRTLEAFGGESACQGGRQIYVELEVQGSDERLRTFVHNQLAQRAVTDKRLVLHSVGAGPAAREDVAEGRMPGVALLINLNTSVNRLSTSTTIGCRLGQTVFELRKERVLRGTATQQAEIDLGSPNVSAQAIEGQTQECVAALVPAVYEEFGHYLKGLK